VLKTLPFYTTTVAKWLSDFYSDDIKKFEGATKKEFGKMKVAAGSVKRGKEEVKPEEAETEAEPKETKESKITEATDYSFIGDVEEILFRLGRLPKTSPYVDEATTMSNISYLPTHVGAVKSIITDLAKEKPDWKIEILEDEDFNNLTIEDRVKFVVPKIHWDGFLDLFKGKIKKGMLSLQSTLDEAVKSDLVGLRKELKKSLLGLFRIGKEFNEIGSVARKWRDVFGAVSYNRGKVAVVDEKMEQDIKIIYGKLLRKYGDDKGHMELLIEAIDDRGHLDTFDVFKDFDFLYGTRIRSTHHGVHLIFEAVVDFLYDVSMSIYIEDSEVLDKIEENYKLPVKRVGKVLWPINGKFNLSFFDTLGHAIEEAVE
jgi:hypothetical protein